MEDFRHYVFCISGYSRTGKDEFASSIVRRHGATNIGMTDIPRRHMMELYGFSREQVFGASQSRNRGDMRYEKPSFYSLQVSPWTEEHNEQYSKNYGPGTYFCIADADFFKVEVLKSRHLFPNLEYIYAYPRFAFLGSTNAYVYIIKESDPVFWLSPREALQLECMLHQDLYEDIWVKKFIETQVGWFKTMKSEFENQKEDGRILYSNPFDYDQVDGFIASPRQWVGEPIIVCSNVRHKHEIRYVRSNAPKFNYIPVIIRIKRPSVPTPPFQHRSEVELSEIPDDAFDFVIDNNDTLDKLYEMAEGVCRSATSSLYVPKTQLP